MHTRDNDLMWNKQRPTVCDVSPTLKYHCVNVSWLLVCINFTFSNRDKPRCGMVITNVLATETDWTGYELHLLSMHELMYCSLFLVSHVTYLLVPWPIRDGDTTPYIQNPLKMFPFCVKNKVCILIWLWFCFHPNHLVSDRLFYNSV